MSFTNTPEGFRDELGVLDERLDYMHIADVSTVATRLRHSVVFACRGADIEWLESFQSLLGTTIERVRRKAKNQRHTGATASFLSAVLLALASYARTPMLPNWVTFAMLFFGLVGLGLGGLSTTEAGNWEKDVLPPLEEALKRVEAAVEKTPFEGHPHRTRVSVRIDASGHRDETPDEPQAIPADRTEKK